MLAAGVDIVSVDRIERAITRWGERFLRRVYLDSELSYCGTRAASLAARWAAKEAVSKALACGFLDVTWREIEIAHHETGQPYVVLHGRALARARALGLTQWALSLSHDGSVAVAFVVAMGAEAEAGLQSVG
ncbi:MAG: holo-ACP synthase [Anaerolineae bacterium]